MVPGRPGRHETSRTRSKHGTCRVADLGQMQLVLWGPCRPLPDSHPVRLSCVRVRHGLQKEGGGVKQSLHPWRCGQAGVRGSPVVRGNTAAVRIRADQWGLLRLMADIRRLKRHG